MEPTNLISEEDVAYIIKQITKGKELSQVNYFEISKTGNAIDLLDIVNELRRHKLNFITSITQRMSVQYGHTLQSFVFEVQNSMEISDFIRLLRKKRGVIKIKDAICEVKMLRGYLKMALVSPPVDQPILNINQLPLCMKFKLNSKYHRFLPSVLLVEILQELKVKEILHKTNGISLKYLTTHRTIGSQAIIRVLNEQLEDEMERILAYLGNSEIEVLIEKQILSFLEVWAQLYRAPNADNSSSSYIMNQNLIDNDILTNGREINSLMNRLGPQVDNNVN